MASASNFAKIQDVVNFLKVNYPSVLDRWIPFCGSLKMETQDVKDWVNWIKNGSLQKHEVFLEMLKLWVSKNDGKSLEDFCHVLVTLEFFEAAVQLRESFEKHVLILISEDYQTVPACCTNTSDNNQFTNGTGGLSAQSSTDINELGGKNISEIGNSLDKTGPSSLQWYASLDEFLEQNIQAEGLVLLGHKRFRLDQRDSSAFSKRPDCPQTLYFEAFKAQPILLDIEENISIYPVFLAKAFLHKDIYNISKELCSAIFTPQDLSRRNSLYQTGITDPNRLLDALPPNKMDLIESCFYVNDFNQMTKWIFEKQFCPWVISAKHLEKVEKYTGTEYLDIDRAFLTFDKISDFREYGVPASDFNQNNPEFQEWLEPQICAEWDKLEQESKKRETDSNYVPTNSEYSDTIHEGTPQDIQFQRIIENYYCENIFKRVIAEMDNGTIRRCTNAELVRKLTLATVPDCKDFFSGATQFSCDRWRKVERILKREGPVQAAEVLFRKFRFDFENNTFNDVDADFCPIKFLDITRAIAKIMEKESEDYHNKFLPWETIDKIKEYLHEKYKGKRYNPKTCTFEPYCFEVNTLSKMQIRNNEPQNIERNIREENMEVDASFG